MAMVVVARTMHLAPKTISSKMKSSLLQVTENDGRGDEIEEGIVMDV